MPIAPIPPELLGRGGGDKLVGRPNTLAGRAGQPAAPVAPTAPIAPTAPVAPTPGAGPAAQGSPANFDLGSLIAGFLQSNQFPGLMQGLGAFPTLPQLQLPMQAAQNPLANPSGFLPIPARNISFPLPTAAEASSAIGTSAPTVPRRVRERDRPGGDRNVGGSGATGTGGGRDGFGGGGINI